MVKTKKLKSIPADKYDRFEETLSHFLNEGWDIYVANDSYEVIQKYMPYIKTVEKAARDNGHRNKVSLKGPVAPEHLVLYYKTQMQYYQARLDKALRLADEMSNV